MMFRKLRKRIGKYILDRKLQKRHREMRSIALKDAKSIGIIFNSKDNLSLKIAKEFQQQYLAKGVNVDILGFHHKRKTEETHISTEISNFVNSKDFNYFYQPKTESILKFIEKPYDILIVFYPKDHFQIRVLSCLSMAKFKVGNGKLNHHSFDLSIECEPTNVEEMFTSATHYLSKITTSKE